MTLISQAISLVLLMASALSCGAETRDSVQLPSSSLGYCDLNSLDPAGANVCEAELALAATGTADKSGAVPCPECSGRAAVYISTDAHTVFAFRSPSAGLFRVDQSTLRSLVGPIARRHHQLQSWLC